MKTSDFVAQISEGLARTSRFVVDFTPPQFILQNTNISSDNRRTIMLLCDTVSLPSASINTSQNRIFGEIREIPTEIVYTPIQMTFYVDIGMQVKTLFDNWVIYGLQNGDTRSFRYYKEYITEMKIYVKDVDDGNRYVVRLYEAYPKAIGPIQLDYSAKDIMKVTVDMQYKYWRSERQDPEASMSGTNLGWDLIQQVGGDQGESYYTRNFDQIQESVNQNLSVTPETMGNITTTAPVTHYGV